MAAQQDPSEEKSIEIDASHVDLWMAMHAVDLEHDEQRGIHGPFFQKRVAFHQQLFAFVIEEEPRVERYRLVKIIEQKEAQHNDTA